jgi:hypothetical protein
MYGTPPTLAPPLFVHAVHPPTMCMRCVVTSHNIGGFSATIYGVTRSDTCGHVAVEKGNLTMHGLDSSGQVKCVKNTNVNEICHGLCFFLVTNGLTVSNGLKFTML